MIEIKKVSNKIDLKKFIDFPHDLYSGDQNYVPELYIAQKELLNKNKHPFFHHSKADFFIAYKNGEVAGRIAGIKNNNYIEYTGDKSGFFGFFDVIDDYEVASALLDTAVEWIKNEELNKMTGPGNYSTNETCGVLVEGFDMPPYVMMVYNKKYYPEFLEHYGLRKERDLLAYKFESYKMPEKLKRVSGLLKKRLDQQGITIRKVNIKNFDQEVSAIHQVYNSAWEKNWGFVPMTEQEFRHVARDMKNILDPDFLFVAEHEGRMVGYSLCIPNINEILIKIRRGRLFPLGIFKLLYYKNKVQSIRVITLGTMEQYRKLGIDAYFYFKVFEMFEKKKMKEGEASWILEDNEMMNRAINNINGKIYKKYRLYTMYL